MAVQGPFVLSNENPQILRPERFACIGQPFFLIWEAKEYPVVDYSAFGLAVLSDHLPEGLFVADLKIVNVILKNFEFRAVRQEAAQWNQYSLKFGLEVMSKPLPLSQIDAIIATHTTLQKVTKKIDEFNHIPFHLKKLVYEVHHKLQILEKEIIAISNVKNYYDFEEKFLYEQEVCQQIAIFLNQLFDSYTSKMKNFFDDLLKQDGEDEFKVLANFFRFHLSDFLQKTPILGLKENPLHIFSNFEYMSELEKYEIMGNTLMGKALSTFFFQHPSVQAMKDRAYYLFYQFLEVLNDPENQKIKILALGACPALEIQLLIEHLKNEPIELEIVFLDDDLRNLKKTQIKLRDLCLSLKKKHLLHFQRLSSEDFIKNFSETHIAKFDVIYSVGMIDYVSDQTFITLLELLGKTVKNVGKILLGTFDFNTPSELLIQLIFNPNLKVRSEKTLKEIFSSIQNMNYSFYQEPGSMNLFSILSQK